MSVSMPAARWSGYPRRPWRPRSLYSIAPSSSIGSSASSLSSSTTPCRLLCFSGRAVSSSSSSTPPPARPRRRFASSIALAAADLGGSATMSSASSSRSSSIRRRGGARLRTGASSSSSSVSGASLSDSLSAVSPATGRGADWKKLVMRAPAGTTTTCACAPRLRLPAAGLSITSSSASSAAGPSALAGASSLASSSSASAFLALRFLGAARSFSSGAASSPSRKPKASLRWYCSIVCSRSFVPTILRPCVLAANLEVSSPSCVRKSVSACCIAIMASLEQRETSGSNFMCLATIAIGSAG
mmetsp:Transcript_17830/g.45624  ORF Transcript_17830/g.45624 Transcript_17830/m.45624 type:complete len:301 (+) Transcript_17830:375-1277(+)